MFQYLLEDKGREQNSNPLTVSTKASIKRSAQKTTPIIKSVWLHHFSDVLITNQGTKMIVDDRKITEKLVQVFEELKIVDKESRWAERKDTENVNSPIWFCLVKQQELVWKLSTSWQGTGQSLM